MTTLEKLQSERALDVQIDESELGQEAIRCARLHQKWLDYLTEFRVKFFAQEAYVKKLEGLRQRYYNGQLSRTELEENGWEPYNHKPPGSIGAMDRLLAGDTTFDKPREKLFWYRLCFEYCEHVLKEIDQRRWNLQTALNWAKFQAGN